MKRSKRLLSLLLVLLLALGLLPGAVLADEGEEYITALNVTYDTSVLELLNTQVTGRQVSEALFRAVTCPKTGAFADEDDWYVSGAPGDVSDYVSICFRTDEDLDPEDYAVGFNSMFNDDTPIPAEGEYYFCFLINDCAKSFDPEALPAVTVNGEAADYVYRWENAVMVYQRVEVAEVEDFCVVLRQPIDFKGEIGATASFRVETLGTVKACQWQVSTDGGETWANSSSSGNKTDTLRVGITETRLAYRYRCRITAFDDRLLYTVPVRMISIAPVDGVLNAAGGALHFVNDSVYPWTPETEDGVSFARSGNGGAHCTESALTLSCTLTETAVLSFEYRVFGEGGMYDFGSFLVDGEEMFECAHKEEWELYATDLEAGEHVLTWVYTKDVSVSQEGDCFEVRNVVLGASVFAVTEQPEDFTGVVGETFTFHVEALGASACQWEVSTNGGSTWKNSGHNGNATDTLTGEITAARLGHLFRCRITGAGGNVVYTNTVRILEAESEIVSWPEDASALPGESFTFHIEAYGSNLSYQWQIWDDSAWADCTLDGAQTDTLSGVATEDMIGSSFRCVVTDRLGRTVDAEVNLWCTPPEIVSQPRPFAGALGDAFTLRIEATGFRLSYQWKVSTDGGESWTNSGHSGNKTPVLTGSITDARLGYLYCCEVTDGTGTVLTSDVTFLCLSGAVDGAVNAPGCRLTYENDGDYPWVIAKLDGELAARSGNSGIDSSTSVLEAAVTLTESTTLSFDYFVEAEENWDTGYFFVDGETVFSTSKTSGWEHMETELSSGEHQLKWRFSKDTSYSRGLDGFYIKNLMVDLGAPLTLDADLEDYAGPLGSTAAFTVEASGEGLTYQWYVKNRTASKFSKSSVTGPTYSVALTEANSGRQLYCVVTDSHGETVRTSTVTMSIAQSLVILNDLEDYAGPEGSMATFTVEASGDGLSYQWWVKNRTASKFSKSSVTGPTYSVALTAANSGRRLYCVVSDARGNTLQTNTVSMSIFKPLTVLNDLADYVGPLGSTASFTVEAEGDGLSYQWWVKKPSASRFSKSSITGPTYSVTLTEARDGNQIYCVVSDAHGSTVQTNTVSMTVGDVLCVAELEDYAGAEGSTATFTVDALGDGLTYEWWVKKPSASRFSKSSITGPTYSVTLTEARNGNQIYCVVMDSHGNAVQTNTVTMIIAEPLVVADLTDYVGPLGSTASFTVAAEGSGLSYQWYVKKPSATKFSKSSITGPTYSVELTEARNGNQIYCVVTDALGNTEHTNTVTMSVG